MKERPSIKTIADLSGVSVATVSRVINQNGRFSAETEERVRNVMKELNYYPNTVAKSLRENHSMVVGVIVPDITNTHFSRLVLEIENYLFQHGYSTVICNTNESLTLEKKHLDTLISQRVSGIFVLSGEHHEMPEDIAVVYVDRRPKGYDEEKDYLVESDNEKGGYLVACKLIERGCRNIAFMYVKDGDFNNNMRYIGYKRAIDEYGLPERTINVSHVSAPVATEAVRRSLKEDGCFDGLACTTDLLAVGSFLGLLEEGIQVPGKVKLTGYDDSITASVYHPSLTSIHQDTVSMAKQSAELFLRQIDGEKIPNKHILIPVRLVEREKTG